MKTLKTHFGSTEEESATETGLCGTRAEFNQDTDWDMVTCNKCLKLKEQYHSEMKEAMEHSCRDMAGYNKFMIEKENAKAV